MNGDTKYQDLDNVTWIKAMIILKNREQFTHNNMEAGESLDLLRPEGSQRKKTLTV